MSKGKKILIIDDEADLRESLKALLQIKGYKVETAGDGLQGLSKLDTFTPDLIILDLNMPNMGGIEFYQKISGGGVPRFPVLVLTARANMEKLFMDFRVDGFITKPFEIAELIKEIDMVIEKKAAKAREIAQKEYSSRKVIVVENDPVIAARLGGALLVAGYNVNLVQSGVEAVERAYKDIPEVVCVQMNLPDVSGDSVIFRLKNLARTFDVKCILYVFDPGSQEEVNKTIQSKEGVDIFVVVKTEKDLIDAIKGL
jgi:DNA-binding response OmpR family regulator